MWLREKISPGEKPCGYIENGLREAIKKSDSSLWDPRGTRTKEGKRRI